MTKEDVFRIMGKYYGNAYYRSAIRMERSEDDLKTLVNMLDEINALGYNYSNVHRLTTNCDPRFIPIILKYYHLFQDNDFKKACLQGICFKQYSFATPDLISLYHTSDGICLRWDISQTLYITRDKKYIPEYLNIVHQPNYGKEPDLVLDILCVFRNPEAMTILRKLKADSSYWTNIFLQYAPRYHDPALKDEVNRCLSAEDPYTRNLARKAIRQMEQAPISN